MSEISRLKWKLLQKLGFAWIVAVGIAYIGTRIISYSPLELFSVLASLGTIGIFIIQYYSKSDSKETQDHNKDNNSHRPRKVSSLMIQPEMTNNTNTKATSEVSINTKQSKNNISESNPIDKSGLMTADGEILSKLGSIISNHVQTYQREETEIDYADLNLYSRMMLYMVVKRLDFEESRIQECKVAPKELEDEFDICKIEVILFIDAAEEFIDISDAYQYDGTPYHTDRWLWNELSYENFDERKFTLKLKNITDAAEWAINEQQSTPRAMKSKINEAEKYVSWALSDYEEGREHERNGDQTMAVNFYDKSETSVINMCRNLQYYPIKIGEDNFWKNFSKYVDHILKCYDNENWSGIGHFLSRAETCIKYRQENIENDRLV